MTPVTSARRTLIAFILLAAAVLFLWRGPWRAIHGGGGDFAAPYVAGARYQLRMDPYSPDGFLDFWHAAGGSTDVWVNYSDRRPVYPPSTLILMFPFTRLNWPDAVAAYVFLCTLLYWYLLYLLVRLIDDDWSSWRRVGFLAYGLVLAPVHTGTAFANLSILAFILCMYSLLFAEQKKDVAAGVVLAIALCIKPTTGILLLPYLLLSRRWRVLATTLGLAVVITAAAMLHMSSIPYAWHIDYEQNVAYLFGPDGVANFATTNPMRFDLMNLQVPFYELTHSKPASNVLSWLTAGLLGIVWAVIFLRGRKKWNGQWEMVAGAIVLLGLLPVYQRNYNAAFVLIALLWAFQNIQRPVAKGVMAFATIFMVPGEAFLRHFYGHIPYAVLQSTLWNFFVMPQANWGALAIALLLLGAMAKMPDASSGKGMEP